MIDDPFKFAPADISAPSRSLATITPHNTNELAVVPKALFIGGSGDITVVGVDDIATVTFTVQAGTLLPVRVKRILATGTTATNIIALI